MSMNVKSALKWSLITLLILVGAVTLCFAAARFGKGLNESVKKTQIDQNRRILLNVGRVGTMVELTNGSVRMFYSINLRNNTVTLLAPDKTLQRWEIDKLAAETRRVVWELAYADYAHLSHRFLVELSTNQATALP